MATEHNQIAVAVEKAVHNAMREMAQAIWDKHGVCVKSVRISWVDMSSIGKPQELLVHEVEADTLTNR